MPVFERLTNPARQVVVLGRIQAEDLKHPWIDSEHILLGLLCEEDGVAAQALRSVGVTSDRVRARVIAIDGVGDEAPPNQMPLMPGAKRAIELALRESLVLGHDYIGTEHILLGLVAQSAPSLDEDEDDYGAAAQILRELGADPKSVRTAVLSRLPVPEDQQRPSGASGRES